MHLIEILSLVGERKRSRFLILYSKVDQLENCRRRLQDFKTVARIEQLKKVSGCQVEEIEYSAVDGTGLPTIKHWLIQRTV